MAFDPNNYTPEQQAELQQYIIGIFASQGKAEKELKLQRFRYLNECALPGQIVFAGSSLMEQFPVNELLTDLKLPYVVYNRGVGGYTTAELLEALGPCVYDLKPRALFLNIGTNDLNGADYTPEAFRQRYRAILDDLRAHSPETKVFMMALYPMNEAICKKSPVGAGFSHRSNARLREASAIVRELAAEYGHRFVSANDGLTDEHGELKPEYTIEGVHMFANAYRMVLNNLLPVLETL